MPTQTHPKNHRPRGTRANTHPKNTRPKTTDLSAPDSPWLSIDDVCAYMGVSRSTLAQWRDEGRFGPALHRLPNRRLLVHRDDLDAWIASMPKVD